MKENHLTEMARNNRLAMITHFICVIFMLLSAGWSFGDDGMSIGLFVTYLVTGVAPLIGELVFWKKNHETEMIKHFVCVGFAIFYSITQFTCINNVQFTFVIPMILAISVYNDTKLSLMVNTGTVIITMVNAIGGYFTGRFGYEDAADARIQAFVMCIIAVTSYMSAKVSRENALVKIEEAEEAKEAADKALKDVTMMSEKMHDGIRGIYNELEQLNKSTKITRDAMDELSLGASNTAEAVQKQATQTEEIQTKVNVVTDVSDQISESMQQTLDVLGKGNKDVEVLVRQVEESVVKGAEVSDKLKNLDSYVEEMHNIIKLISGIANQTSMLALNASIEAARAGESGRGFAVVASQVTNMAKQTKDATVNISELIENVSTAISEVVEVIGQMLEGIQEEKKSTNHTAESFESIQNNTLSTKENVATLEASIHELKKANRRIVDSIETISATTQEVSAHAGETVEASKHNEDIINNIDNMMQDLIQYIHLNGK